jgi:hypothetical protein
MYSVLLFQDPSNTTHWLGFVPAVPVVHSWGESQGKALWVSCHRREIKKGTFHKICATLG